MYVDIASGERGTKTKQTMDTMNFSSALELLKAGKRMSRLGWNGKNMYVALQVPDEHSKMKRPYIYIVPNVEWVVPWVASQWDLLADDWLVVE
jgi:hypothetical protein